MKILYVITKSNWGGAQKYVFDLATRMPKFGYEVVVAFGGEGKLSQKLKEANIKTIQIPNLERDVNILKEIKVLKDLKKVLKDENPDIVHLNSSKIGILGSILARMVNLKKIIFTAHGFAFREERPKWQIYLIKFLSWLTILFSHKTICVSEKDFEDVKNWPFVKNKLETIHNGIEIEESTGNLFSSLENQNLETEKKESSEIEIIKIVSIGELHKNKGFLYALEAINLLRYDIENFKYTIFSFGGDEKEKIEREIKSLNLEKYVELVITQEKSDDKLKDFDIYFLPSIKEGLPYVLLEASLNFLPMVASDVGGVKEILENYKNGFLIKAKDIHAFKTALEKLIKDKALRQDFAKEARDIVESKFNIEKMIEKTRNLYF